MSEHNSDDFKFGADHEIPDEVLQAAPEDKRIAKLSRRITVLAIIMPCLIGVALFFLYLDLKGRVIQNQTSGNQSVAELSQDFADQLQAISEKLTQLETGLSENSTAVEKRMDDLKKQVGAIESGLKKVSSNLKQANSSLEKINAAKANKTDLEGMGEKLTALSSQVNTRNDALDKKVDELSTQSEKIGGDMSMFREDIGEFSALLDSKIDRRTLLLELDKQQQKMTVLSGDLEKKIITIRSDLRRLNKDLEQARKTWRRSATTVPQPPGSAGQGLPDKDKIIEQNLE
jgi:DNA repair exonuclease SbcCD ATPase subunit